MTNFHIVKVKANNRYLVNTVQLIEEVIEYIEEQYFEKIEYLENVTEEQFKNDIEKFDKYDNGLYIIECPDKVIVYKVSTAISFGYLFNSALRKIKIVDTYEIIVEDDK